LSRCCINLRFNTWFVTNSRQRQFVRQSYGSCPVNHRNRSDFEIATLPEVFEVGTSIRMLWRLQELANRSCQRRRRLLDSARNSYQTIFATDLPPGFTVIANRHQIDIDRLTVVRLTVAFENIQQSRAVVVLDVCYSPGSSFREQPKLDFVFLSEILEGHWYHYHPRSTNSLLNREILDVHVLSIEKRISVQRSNLVTGRVGILPKQVSQLSRKIFVQQSTAPSLKKWTLLFVLPIE